MKHFTAGSLAALALVAVMFSTARADEPTLGSPGSPNCRGQTTAFLAQAQKNGTIGDALRQMGFAGYARSQGYTVQEIHQAVDEFCGSFGP